MLRSLQKGRNCILIKPQALIDLHWDSVFDLSTSKWVRSQAQCVRDRVEQLTYGGGPPEIYLNNPYTSVVESWKYKLMCGIPRGGGTTVLGQFTILCNGQSSSIDVSLYPNEP